MTTPQSEKFSSVYSKILHSHPNLFNYEERKELRAIFEKHSKSYASANDNFELSLLKKLKIAEIVLVEIGLGKSAILSVLFYELVQKELLSVAEIEKKFNTQVATIIEGILRVGELYARNASLETENFRKLFLTFAQDIRVILIVIAEHLHIMRTLKSYPEGNRQKIARESSFLYAPLAHRMGLYAIKTEFEDLSLKYTNRDIYREIAEKINETKQSRDKYISEFITPLKDKLSGLGFDFEIKGRTKSIHSIYSKIKKQNTNFENIYDLFAIRIIFDVPLEKEKAACWQAYSIVADMYQPNPKRLRDWLSIPKTNGYESLHTTVLGPGGKWVEVQIRTERMDEVAEKGLAAHWKYKGIKNESGMDEWLKNIREILENPALNAIDFMDDFKLNLYDKEVFVFTPNGDLHKLPKGATVLDFAFSIHTALGSKCVGAKVNDKNMTIKYVLNNGDQVEVLTSPTQKPNSGWLKVVKHLKKWNLRMLRLGAKQLLDGLKTGKLNWTRAKFLSWQRKKDILQSVTFIKK